MNIRTLYFKEEEESKPLGQSKCPFLIAQVNDNKIELSVYLQFLCETGAGAKEEAGLRLLDLISLRTYHERRTGVWSSVR